MATFYRGAAVGTYWHMHSPIVGGVTPKSAGLSHTVDRVKQHVARGTTGSPYVSLTRSWAVALDYALNAGTARPTSTTPAFVYEFDIVPGHGVTLLDPVEEVAASLGGPFAAAYYHDGPPAFLLGVVDPVGSMHHLFAPKPVPPGALPPGAPRLAAGPPKLTIELETLVRSLRDAEVLAVGTIPIVCLMARYSVW